jgi:hypothetical protein
MAALGGGTAVGRIGHTAPPADHVQVGTRPEERDTGTGAGTTDPGGPCSKEQIERFRCPGAGTPTAVVDISCNTTTDNKTGTPTTRSPWPSTRPTLTTSRPAPTTTSSTTRTRPPGRSTWTPPIMVTKSTNGGESFGQPVPTVQLEDGLSDMPFAVISRQTV